MRDSIGGDFEVTIRILAHESIITACKIVETFWIHVRTQMNRREERLTIPKELKRYVGQTFWLKIQGLNGRPLLAIGFPATLRFTQDAFRLLERGYNCSGRRLFYYEDAVVSSSTRFEKDNL